MTYTLVHLVEGPSSETAGLLIDHLERTQAPTHTFREASPVYSEVCRAVASSDGAPTAVCVAHGGSDGLCPTPGRIWADAQQLGHVFENGRLYAYACSTTGDMGSLGARAVSAGVAVFIGHDRVIEAPLPDHERRMVAEVAAAAILAFVAGEDDEHALSQAIHAVGDEFLGDDIDLDFMEHSNWMSQSLLFDQLAFSLRVHRRAEGP